MKRLILTLLLVLLFAPLVQAETLEQAWKTATTFSNRLRAEAHQVEAARAEVQLARSARNPVLSNHTAYTALSDQPAYVIGLPGVPQEINMPLSDQQFATTSTNVSVPIYTGGKINAMVAASRYQLNAASAGYASSFQDLKMEVADSYFNVLRTRQLLRIAQTSEDALMRHQHDVEKQLRQKVVTRNALLAAQAAYSAAAQERLKAENMVSISESAYNRHMGRQLDSWVDIEEMPVPPLSGDLNVLTQDAIRNRKELTQIASQSQASASLSRASNADRLPQVVAMGGHTYMQNSYLNEESYWSGSVGLRWTPIDGGASRAKSRAAVQNSAAAARIWNETCSQIALQVRSAWILEQETRSRIEVANLGEEQANENLRVVTRQFQEGLVNHTEVLDAQTLQTKAAVNRCNAIYDAILASCQLQRAAGRM